jgi:Mg/Co/Ni transporter MgtE
LEYLEGIINDEERAQMKQKLSERSVLRFVELMAQHKPDQLMESLKKNSRFSIEESLKICEKYHVYDCMEYLYERMGSIVESVRIAALRIDRILTSRNDYDE